MIASINEREMYVAHKYCLDYIKSLSEILVLLTRSFNGVINSCKSKISTEQNDIKDLENKDNLCDKLISENNKRISEIPQEISDLEDENIRYEEIIDSIPVPVYTWREDWRGNSYTVIDHDATENNESRISYFNLQIYENNLKISQLENLLVRCENNVVSLNKMKIDIGEVIKEKRKLIKLITSNINNLTLTFNNFKNELSKNVIEITTLKDKISKGAEFIHSYGTTMAQISYNDAILRYNDNDIFSMNSEGINQVIQMLQQTINANLVSISTCSKGLFNYTNQLKDNLSEQVKIITVDRAMKLKKINEKYQHMVNVFKKAQTYLVAYEIIKI